MQIGDTRLDSHTPSFMHPVGAPAASQAELGWALTIVAIATVLIVAIILVIALARRRPEPSETDPGTGTPGGRWQVASGIMWIYVGLAITVVVLLVAFGATIATINASAVSPTPPPITLNITAHQWWWEVAVSDSVPSNTFTTANEVHIPVGIPILLRVQSADVIHSFWVPELGGKIDVIPGQINESWIRANRTGVFRGQCAEYCGLQHAHMAFTVVAQSPRDYQAWAAAQRASAPTPVPGTPLASGESIFATTCGACHAVRGTSALGRVGPDLTHLASRMTIAAGLVDNTPKTLTEWIRDPQAMKPGVMMPVMHLPPNELASVVAYLETLH